MSESIISLLRKKNPLIHCITNPISINDCANALIATGARPIMAEHPKEVCEIVKNAGGLLLNLGSITEARMEAIFLAGETAEKNGVPIVFDIVGAGCSSLRREFIKRCFENFIPDIIKGNSSEILALTDGAVTDGTDADKTENADDFSSPVRLSLMYNTTVLVSGKRDIITDGESVFFCKNGTDALARITGTGCMQGALAAAYLSVLPPIQAALTAAEILGICGELSAKKADAPGSFRTALIDEIWNADDETLKKMRKTEKIR